MLRWTKAVWPATASSIAPPCASSSRTPEAPATWRASITPTSLRAAAVPSVCAMYAEPAAKVSCPSVPPSLCGMHCASVLPRQPAKMSCACR